MALRSTSRPPIKGRVIPRVPATLQATDGLEVSKENGVWTFGHDWEQLTEGGVTDAENQQVLVFNAATDVFTTVSFQTMLDAGSGAIPSDDAPLVDGVASAGVSALYSRGDHVHPAGGGTGVDDGDYGDITVSSSGATWTIDADTVTFAKMQNASGASVLVGRGQGGGAGDLQEVTLGSNISMTGTVLNVSSGTAVLGDGDYGDIVVSSSGTIMTVDTGVVTFAKMQTIGTDSLIGRDTAGTGAPESITLGASLSMNGSGVLQRAALTGDVTASAGSNATTIASDAVTTAKIIDNAVTNAKLANVATSTIKGRVTASTGDPEDLSGTQATTLLDVFTSSLKGVVPGSGGGTSNFLRADGTWAAAGSSSGAGTDALAYNGLQINGGMEVDQPNAGASVAIAAGTVAKTHSADGWYVAKPEPNAFGIQQTTSVFTGYTKELKLTITTAQASISSDTVDIRQAIEGYRIARLAWGTASAIPLTIGFWVKSSVSGTLSVLASNSTLATTATASVTITSAAVAEFVTATFAAQTTGTWLTDNSAGIIISVRVAGSGSINIAATNGNTFEITGVVVLPGTQTITSAQSPLLMRPYGEELAVCKRYYEIGTLNQFSGNVTSGSSYSAATNYSVEKRALPTVTLTDVAATSTNFPAASGTLMSSGNSVMSFGENRTANGNRAGTFRSSWKADARL